MLIEYGILAAEFERIYFNPCKPLCQILSVAIEILHIEKYLKSRKPIPDVVFRDQAVSIEFTEVSEQPSEMYL